MWLEMLESGSWKCWKMDPGEWILEVLESGSRNTAAPCAAVSKTLKTLFLNVLYGRSSLSQQHKFDFQRDGELLVYFNMIQYTRFDLAL